LHSLPRSNWASVSCVFGGQCAEILGTKYNSPIVIAPAGSNRAFHPDAEIAVAKAAKAGNHLQILSTVATTSIEDAIAARGAPVWFQLYSTQRWEVAEGSG
jgi:4-hydroxymandelate oxidase